jgi:hypothetical protein
MSYVEGDNETAAGLDTRRSDWSADGVLAAARKQPAPLMGKDEGTVAKLNASEWERLEQPMRAKKARWAVNRLRRQGVIGVYAYKPDKDRNEWRVYVPLGAKRVPHTFNQLARLGRRLKSNLFADPPTPEAVPDTDADEDRGAAEFTTRVLQVEGSSAGYNNLRSARRSFDVAITYDSGFRYHYVDPKGGGRQPKSIQASAQARTVRDALYKMVTTTDPLTGEASVSKIPQPPPYVTRFVKPAAPVPGLAGMAAAPGADPAIAAQAVFDAELTDDPGEADYEWLPKIKHRVLSGRNVRIYPESALDVSDASEVRIAELVTLGELKRQYDRVATMTDEQLRELAKYRPPHPKDLLPQHQKDSSRLGADSAGSGAGEKSDGVSDQTLVFVCVTVHRSDSEYVNGCFVVTGGDCCVLERREWVGTKPNGVKVPLLIPVDQCKGWEEGEDDQYGFGLAHLLGPGNELRASLFGAYLEHLDRFNRRKVWYPWNSPLSPKEMQAESGTYLPYNPQIGMPKVEEVPAFDANAIDMIERATNENNSDAGLEPSAQGQNPPGVESGYHAQQLIEQVAVGLSDVKQACEDMITRGWLIDAQLIMAFYTVPQRVAYVGDDGQHKEKEFTGADLGGFKDIQILKGSFTMMSPSAKMAVTEHMMSGPVPVISPQEGRRIILGNVGGLIGVQDDPHFQRVRQQVARFLEGPPKDLPEPQWAEVAAGIFDRRPTDLMPAYAEVRETELARAVAGTKYGRLPVNWRAYLDNELAQMTAAKTGALAPGAPAPDALGPGGTAPMPQLGAPSPLALTAPAPAASIGAPPAAPVPAAA